MGRSSRRAGGSQERGFTLIEMFVVLGIIAVLSALAITSWNGWTARSRMNNATFHLASYFTIAQNRARSTGDFQYVVLWQTTAPQTDGSTFGVYLVDRPTSLTNWSSAIAASASSLGTVVDRTPLSTGGFSFTAIDQLRFTQLPSPFSSIALSASGSSSSLLQACTFCISTSDGAIGAIEFSPEGQVRIATGSNPAGAAVALAPTHQTDSRVIAISAPGGVVKVY